MSPDGAHRLEEILALLPEEELQSLARSLDSRDNIAAVRDLLLGEEGYERLVSELDEDTLAALHQLANAVPPPLPDVEEGDEELPDDVAELIDRALVFAVAINDETRIYVPLELQLLLHQAQPQTDPDLRLLLLGLDEEALAGLEAIYLSATSASAAASVSAKNDEDDDEEEDDDEDVDDVSDDPVARVCRLANVIESPTTLREVYETLPATAREVLGWTCEHGGPLSVDEVQELARDAAAYHEERAGVAVAQLVRFGLLLPYELEESGEVYVVPRSFRRDILRLIDQLLTAESRGAYEALMSAGHLSFPDEGPHGWGGDALRSFRQLTINWVAGRTVDDPPSELGVAVGMQILDPNEHRTGPFASLLLDLSGETAFSRQALRLWLALIDDPWTTELVNTTGGDSARLVSHFSGRGPEEADDDADVWLGHLFLLRAQLVLTLSLLPPGKWFPIEALAHLFHLLVVRATLVNLGQEVMSAQFPYEALPDYGVVLARADRRQLIGAWIERWLVEFAGVIGAAEVDPSGTHFRVHPDAFCVFRDSDLWFRTVWDDLSPIVGDDLEIWMPIPNDPGPRVAGVSAYTLPGGARIAVQRNVHLFDLVRLAQWAVPTEQPAGYAFELTEESVNAALESGLDGEEMLLWLAVRLESEVPTALRGLFPQSSSVVDAEPGQVRARAAQRVEELMLSLESWGTSPPGRLLEELRGWGTAAVDVLERRLEVLVLNGRLADPLAQHLCVLLGELGATSSIPTLVSILLTCQSEVLQHASAAAFMRIGEPALERLIGIAGSPETPRERRLLAVMALTGLATLHPHTHNRVGDLLIAMIEANAFDADLQTRVALELCRMGHQKSEQMVEALTAEESWSSDEWRPEDALWLVRVSPCVWGSLLFSTPMAMLYLVSDEADELAQEAGVRDLIRSVGLSSESVLYGRPRVPGKG